VSVVGHAYLATRELLEREGSLAVLHDALADADEGTGMLVLVGGDAGVGAATQPLRAAVRRHEPRPVRRPEHECPDAARLGLQAEPGSMFDPWNTRVSC
jgi:hypothetical protein